MRVVVTGATGNVGSTLVRALLRQPEVERVVGVARRLPDQVLPGVTWVAADVAETDLRPVMRQADAVVHLAWTIQPSHDEIAMTRTNVLGSGRVFEAAAEAGVGKLVYASSVGAYSPGPKDRLVDESWPVRGIGSSFYSRHKATVEHMLDDIEDRNPAMRVVRMRPALIFKRAQAAEARRYFLGPLMPGRLLSPGRLPVVPDIAGLRFQAVHTSDVVDAYVRALTRPVRGPFNLAADPVVDMRVLARTLDAPALPVPAAIARTAVRASWRAHLQPTPPGWLDMGLLVPLLSSGRARRELGWRPRRSSLDAIVELLAGIGDAAGAPIPPLEPRAGGPLRIRELATGIGTSDDVGSRSRV